MRQGGVGDRLCEALGEVGRTLAFTPVKWELCRSSEQGRHGLTQVLTGALWLLRREQTIMCEGRSWEMSTSSVELHLNVFVFPDIKMFTAIFWRAFGYASKTVSFAPLSF